MVSFEKVPLLLGLALVLTLVGAPTKAVEPVCRQAETFSRASFPEGFIWGTATAAFQVNLIKNIFLNDFNFVLWLLIYYSVVILG